jgi:preprotein translocase subunit SecE
MSEETKKTNWLTSWCKGLKAEFKKIVWPTRETITKETTAVLFVSVMLGALITVIDLIIRTAFEFIF